MSLILCIETGTQVCSVALCRSGELLALRESEQGRDHARQLGVFVQQVLHQSGVEAGELAAVAVSSGPGSYTGLRIGVSLAKGLCYGLGIPLISIGSLDALVAVAMDSGVMKDARYLCPMIDARRMEVYAQVFDGGGNPVSPVEAEIVTEESFARWRSEGDFAIFGDGAQKCVDVLKGVQYIEVGASARGQVRLAYEAFMAGRFEDTAYFEPFYLKDFVIKTSTKKPF